MTINKTEFVEVERFNSSSSIYYTQKYEKYELGPNVCIDDIAEKDSQKLTIGSVVTKMFATDGVDDKVRFTITSMETMETIFTGRNMELRDMPVQLFVAPIVAIDDVGDGNAMNFYISTSMWTLK